LDKAIRLCPWLGSAALPKLRKEACWVVEMPVIVLLLLPPPPNNLSKDVAIVGVEGSECGCGPGSCNSKIKRGAVSLGRQERRL
jgi:hypothetical protein